MKKRVQAIVESLERQGIDVAGISPRFEESLSRIHLRSDRVARRFVHDLQSALREAVPEGRILVFTITAPLRLASKTAAAMEESLRAVLQGCRTRVSLDETINGNRIRVRLLKGVSKEGRVLGFVHNPDRDPDILFDVTQSLLREMSR